MKKRRKPTRRHNRRKLPFSVRFGMLVAVLVMAVVVAGVLMAPGFKVSEVYCEGNVNVSSDEIFTAAQIENGKNIFLIGMGKAERNIEKLPMVKKATMKRVFPNKIGITIEEREPVAYIKAGGECAAIDKELIIIRRYDPSATAEIVKNAVPDFDVNTEDEAESETEENEEEEAPAVQEDTPAEEPQGEAPAVAYFNIPLVEGVELKDAEENKKAKSDNEDKLNAVVEICDAFGKAGLLNKTTYLDVTDMQNIRIVVENRLDIRIGSMENIEYRATFLAEVINNKISSYEKLILDYTGDDIYARAHDDGRERTRIEKDEPSEADAGDEETETEKEEGTEEETEADDETSGEESDEESGGVRTL